MDSDLFTQLDKLNNTNLEEDNSFIPDFKKLEDIFPTKLTNHFNHIILDDIIEIRLEMGRRPEVKHAGGRIDFLGNIPILFKDIDYIKEKLPDIEQNNFIEIPGTLHRIKVIRDFQNKISGIICLIGRLVTESIDNISDIVTSSNSILFLGRSKSGKTTKLRECAILLSTECKKNVVVIDPFKDILGESKNIHPALKNVKRIIGEDGQFKKDLMLEADEIYSPDVIVVDELTTKQELDTVKTLTQKGIKVVSSMLGTNLDALLKNPTLFWAVGGVKAINFTEQEQNNNIDLLKKTTYERVYEPIFQNLIEIINVNTFFVYKDTKAAVDGTLAHSPINPELRGVGVNNINDDRYKNTQQEDEGQKDVRVKSMKAIIQESFFHGASWMGQNFIA